MKQESIFRLEGKNAIITGAGSGIGRAIAVLFARQGARVDVLDVDQAGAAETVAAIRQDGGTASFEVCDISDHAAAGAAIRKAAAARGRLDILVNNAGIAHVGSVLSTSEEDFDRIYRVNVKGVFNCLKAGVELMATAGGGAIVNLASTASLIGIPDRFAYSMSKGAVLTMTLSVARDYLEQKIRCNAICPGRIHTPFVDGFIRRSYPGREAEMFEKLSAYQPIGRMGKPEEVAAVALFLASDESSFVTGSAYTVDGGTFALR